MPTYRHRLLLRKVGLGPDSPALGAKKRGGRVREGRKGGGGRGAGQKDAGKSRLGERTLATDSPSTRTASESGKLQAHSLNSMTWDKKVAGPYRHGVRVTYGSLD
jgi:hypothetical protein